jgi:hypothetical protein
MSQSTVTATGSGDLKKKVVSQAYFWVPWLVIGGLVALKIAL